MSEYRVKMNVPPVFSRDMIEKAFDAPRSAYYPYEHVNCDNELRGTGALLYLLLCEKYHPGTVSVTGETALDRIMISFRSLICGGREPSMRVGPMWGHPLASGAITLARSMPSVWSRFTEEERARLDEIMLAFAVTCSWATADQNDFWTGPEMFGNYRKSWNPNHRSPGVLPIVFASVYFGSAEKVNDMLVSFDYDSQTALLEKYGMTNILRTWRAAGKQLMEQGGDAFLAESGEAAGSGKGVKYPYVYRGIPLTDTCGLINEILLQNTKGGPVVDVVGDKESGACGYLMKGSSPVLGLDGMMSEFVSHDAKGIRSDIIYCSSNFCILVPTMAAAIALGIWDPSAEANAEASEKTAISIIDFLYKIENGYYSYSHGAGRPTGEKGTHGVYFFAKDMWKQMLQ